MKAVVNEINSDKGNQVDCDALVFLFVATFRCFFGEEPRSRCYGCTAALRLIVERCDEDDSFFFRFSL
jgi:hypothetical protein